MNKDYLGFRRWYNSNKDKFEKDESNEKIAFAAWIAAKEQSSKKHDDTEAGFYLETN